MLMSKLGIISISGFTFIKEKEGTGKVHKIELIKQKTDTIATLKEEVEMAMVASMAFYEKLKAIWELDGSINNVL